jgi:hypothetical protein
MGMMYNILSKLSVWSYKKVLSDRFTFITFECIEMYPNHKILNVW